MSLCCLCLDRSDRQVTEKQKDIIKKHVFKEYGEHEGLLPKGICNGCRSKLSTQGSSKPIVPSTLLFPSPVQDLSSKRDTQLGCQCELCKLAKSAHHEGKMVQVQTTSQEGPSPVQHPWMKNLPFLSQSAPSVILKWLEENLMNAPST